MTLRVQQLEDGKWRTLTPTELTVVRAAQVLSAEDVDQEAAEQISRLTGAVAAELISEGWFTEEEYVDDLVRQETETLMEELQELSA